MKVKIISSQFANSCYFRTSVTYPNRKALIKITDICNLKCAHCFVSANKVGHTMPMEKIRELVPKLIKCNVISVTLTGGEPFLHPNILSVIQIFIKNNIKVSICTNATSVLSNDLIEKLSCIKGLTINVSLDGFSENSHGKFRGNKKSFYETINNIEKLSKLKLLKGFLVTPNNLADEQEYYDLCKFAIKNNAQYVLMNPLSSFGRGIKSKNKLSSSDIIMNNIKRRIFPLKENLEIVDIRFPNINNLPLSSCEAGNIIYIFTNGDITPCPYLVFATENINSKYNKEEFIIGNLFSEENIHEKLNSFNLYDKYNIGMNNTCKSCEINKICNKGCPAAIVASGQYINGIDLEQCSKV